MGGVGHFVVRAVRGRGVGEAVAGWGWEQINDYIHLGII